MIGKEPNDTRLTKRCEENLVEELVVENGTLSVVRCLMAEISDLK